VAYQKLVKSAQSAEPKLDGSAAEVVPAEEAKIGAKIIPLQFIPGRILFAVLDMPGTKLG